MLQSGAPWMPTATFPRWLSDSATWLPTHAYAALGQAIDRKDASKA